MYDAERCYGVVARCRRRVLSAKARRDIQSKTRVYQICQGREITHCKGTTNLTVLGGCGFPCFTSFIQKFGRNIRSWGFPLTYCGYLGKKPHALWAPRFSERVLRARAELTRSYAQQGPPPGGLFTTPTHKGLARAVLDLKLAQISLSTPCHATFRKCVFRQCTDHTPHSRV